MDSVIRSDEQLLAACDARIRHSAQNKVAELLQQQEPSYWAVLDEKIRSNLYRYHSKLFYPWYQLTIQELNSIIADSDVPEVIIQLLCCHRDGYIREAAVQLMAETPALFLAPLLIRANDWVTKVKLLAYGAIWSCMDQLANTDWVGYLQLIERLRYQSRHDHRDLLLAIEQKFRNNHSLGRLGKHGAGMNYPLADKNIS